MLFPILATIFFLTLLVSIVFFIGLIIRPPFWQRHFRMIGTCYAAWIASYVGFIVFFTGPTDFSRYPARESSPYKLPWKAGVRRFVGQGNRSFTSHRDAHLYAWDFVIANGTEILAARDGRVIEVEDSFDGFGAKSNYVTIEHEDGQRSVYAHIRHNGSLVRAGDGVKQGQPIALSGMVGQTLFPHVHFYVTNKEGKSSIPISFREVPNGVPLAGRFYTSENAVE